MAFTSADALTRFLTSTADPAPRGSGIERIVGALRDHGNAMAVKDLFGATDLSRPEFLDALGSAVSGQIVEKFTGADGADWVRASSGALALF